jgi:polyhydroxyalkanoate synthesis regulator protein
MRQQMAQAFGAPFEAYEETLRQNMAMFERAFRMFSPFAVGELGEPAQQMPRQPTTSVPAPAKSADTDLDVLRKQVFEMQRQLDAITKKT